MKRLMKLLLLALASLAACASKYSDRRADWRAIALISFDRNGSGDRSYLASSQTDTGSPTYTQGVISLDGTDDWVSIPDHVLQRSYPLSILCWFNMDGQDQAQYASLVDKYNTGSLNGWQVFTYDDEKIYAYYLGGSLSNCIYGGGVSALNTGATAYKSAGWTHLAVVFSSSGGEIWINGVSVDTQAWTGTPTASTSTHRIGIGQHNFSGGRYFKGKIDDVRVYNYALTTAEIGAIYSSGKGVSRP